MDSIEFRPPSPEVRQRFEALKARPVLLELSGVSKVFSSKRASELVLEGVDLRVHHREFLSVIGPSGCGKSTLARLIAGLELPTSGSLMLDGKPIKGPGPDRGMVFQSYSLFPWLTVRANVAFPLELQGHGRAVADAEARTWVDIVGLSAYEDHYPAQLSGGMKQRVAIARALAARPRVLLMDEPFGALDAQTRAKMQAYLLEVWRKVDVTIVFITHDLEEAVYLSDRILVLDAHPGKVRELIEVPVPQPRRPEQFLSPEFLAVKNRLSSLIHPREAEDFEMVPMAAAEPQDPGPG